MAEMIELPFEYEIAEGPNGLADLLDQYLAKAGSDKQFASSPHFILYQLGAQRSVIKVDMSSKPCHFWYCDLQGRPMTTAVKRVIADFLWEKCNSDG